MTEILTHAEYQAIAADLNLPCNAFIDGKYQPAKSKKTFASINPATGKTIAEIAACDTKDVDLAVSKSREAFADGRWSRQHPAARKRILIRLARLMQRNGHELAVMESIDSGKQALRVAREIRAGTVTINCYGEGDITTPFGGYKQSGFGGRDNSLHAHDQYTELKTIWIDLSDRNQADPID
ncbi:MAG: aldehyde dehydrogenase family protein [Gammaproteobacteria bacterium]|nr:aldehyde dehydrogenase family protein [Gammaproteobacteria bacterium]